MRGHDITEKPSRVRRAGLGGRRIPPGPHPVRPRVVPVGVRPVQPARPASPPAVRRSSALALLVSSLGSSRLGSSLLGAHREVVGQRVLTRRRVVPALPVGVRGRAQRALIVAGLMAATATAVVLLGLLADVVAGTRATAPAPAPAAVTAVVEGAANGTAGVAVTVDAEATVWEVAREVAPGASGPELAVLAERIVADNALSSVRVHPGQVLRVTVG